MQYGGVHFSYGIVQMDLLQIVRNIKMLHPRPKNVLELFAGAPHLEKFQKSLEN